MFLGRDMGGDKNYSEQTAQMVDQEVKKFLDQAHERAQEVLTRRRDKLNKIAERLIEKEVIEHAEFDALVKEDAEVA